MALADRVRPTLHRDARTTTTGRGQLTAATSGTTENEVDNRDETPGTHPCPQPITPRPSRRRHPPKAHRWIEAKRAADTYMSDVDGFMSSNPLEVGDGWTCQISIRDRGEIVRCSVGQREISLNRRIGQAAGPGKGTDAGTFSPSS
ncbi:hypothetical protein [Gordonia paraffinivorans]|uniref:hypothetical protein n=1 Tax=Gordonia paraffinivorans TaxID=175628 RepID=UPI00215A2966|nr:hypothetical protein [Gordonia paraffinivorans]